MFKPLAAREKFAGDASNDAGCRLRSRNAQVSSTLSFGDGSSAASTTQTEIRAGRRNSQLENQRTALNCSPGSRRHIEPALAGRRGNSITICLPTSP